MQLQCISFARTDGDSSGGGGGDDGGGKLVLAFTPSTIRAASSYARAAFLAVSNVPSQILVFLQCPGNFSANSRALSTQLPQFVVVL
jgi:hypothetical protein